jgi:hypothetical protein
MTNRGRKVGDSHRRTRRYPGAWDPRKRTSTGLVAVSIVLVAMAGGAISPSSFASLAQATSPGGGGPGLPQSAPCGDAPTLSAIGGSIDGLHLDLKDSARSTAIERVSELYNRLCQDHRFTTAVDEPGGPGVSLGLYATTSQGLVSANLTLDSAGWLNGTEYESQEWWSMNETSGAISGPFNSSAPAGAVYGGNSESQNWGGYQFTGGSSDPAVYETLADTQVMSMTADPSGQTLPPDTGATNSVAAVWVGLSPQSGGGVGAGSASLLQTGYTDDPSAPSASWCAGFSGSCTYGFWWEAIYAGTWTCDVGGVYMSVCPNYPYSGDPVGQVGDILQEAVWESGTGWYSTEVYNSNTNQIFENSIQTGTWDTPYADYIVEAPIFTSGSVWNVAQIADFSSETVDFENGYICASGTCYTPSQAYGNNWYSTFYIDQGIAVNTNSQFVNGYNFAGSPQDYPSVQWLSSLYEYCGVDNNNPHCSQSGGGGCVAGGTPILTPYGYLPVESLHPGAPVEEYNFTSGQMYTGRLISENATNASRLTVVNHGLLDLTPTDQPVFIRNATYEGWLHDPQNLTNSDYLFDPVTSSWIPITSVVTLRFSSPVYDVVTSDTNNFVANGVLLDLK